MTSILLPYTLLRRKYLLLAITTPFLVIFCATARYYFLLFLHNLHLSQFSPPIFFNNISHAIFSFETSISLALSYWLLKRFVENEKQKTVIQKTRNSLNRTILNAELLGLKNQINPHFIYNILNFLYAQSLPFSSKLSKSIITLSEIMRYAIRESNDVEGKSSLEQEVAYIQNYVLLENYQRELENQVKLEIRGNLRYRRIIPLTFQPLLEYSYKFGKDIKILIIAHENQIQFSSEYIKKENIEESTLNTYFNLIKDRIFYKDLLLNYNSSYQSYNINLLINI